MIERLTGKTGPASQRAHIDDHTTLLTSLRILIPKDAQGPLGHVDHTPKVGIKHSSRLAILGAFGVAGESVTGVVDDDIDTAKLLQGGAKCGINGRNRSDVQFKLEDAVIARNGPKSGGLPCGCHNPVGGLSDELSQCLTNS